MPVENCFISLNTNFSFHFSKFWAVLPKKSVLSAEKVGKNWEERGWGLTYVCLGLKKIHSRCWTLVPVRVIALGIGQTPDCTGWTLLFRINNIPALFCWRVFDSVVCTFPLAVHGCTPFLVYILYSELFCPGTHLLLRIPNEAIDNGYMKTWRIQKGRMANSPWVTFRGGGHLHMPAVPVAAMRYNPADMT
jgi:hypothetical protein